MEEVVITLRVCVIPGQSLDGVSSYILSLAGGLTITTDGNIINISAANNVILINLAEKLKALNIAFEADFTII